MTGLPARKDLRQHPPKPVREVFQATLFPDYQPTELSLGFLARAFIVATLPHSRPQATSSPGERSGTRR